MRGKWRLMCILDFFDMKNFAAIIIGTEINIYSKCVLFKNNLLPSDTVPLTKVFSLDPIGFGLIPLVSI